MCSGSSSAARQVRGVRPWAGKAGCQRPCRLPALTARQGKGHFCIASDLVCVHVAGPPSKWRWPAQVPMEAQKQCRSLLSARLWQIQSLEAPCLPIVLLGHALLPDVLPQAQPQPLRHSGLLAQLDLHNKATTYPGTVQPATPVCCFPDRGAFVRGHLQSTRHLAVARQEGLTQSKAEQEILEPGTTAGIPWLHARQWYGF